MRKEKKVKVAGKQAIIYKALRLLAKAATPTDHRIIIGSAAQSFRHPCRDAGVALGNARCRMFKHVEPAMIR